MIKRDANINIITCYGEEEAEKRIGYAQNVTNSSAYKYYDVNNRKLVPQEPQEPEEDLESVEYSNFA